MMDRSTAYGTASRADHGLCIVCVMTVMADA